jgi:hemolysin III
MANTHTFSRNEEMANAITHGVGALLSIAALVFLIVHSTIDGSGWHLASAIIYGITMILLYMSSTLVHSFPKGKVKDLFEIFDHSSIYLFIAGTYTPFLFIVIKGALGWTLFGIIWGIALSGVVFKSFFVKKFIFLSTLFYILMGWLIVFAWKPLIETMPDNGLVLLVIGGALYTIGTIFYMWRSFPFHHAVWHVFVLAGTAVHFFAVLFYVLPMPI